MKITWPFLLMSGIYHALTGGFLVAGKPDYALVFALLVLPYSIIILWEARNA